MVEMANKMGGYRFTNPLNLAVMATRGVNRSPFMEWIVEEPKPKDFVVPTFKQFDEKFDPVDHIFNFQQKMALKTRNGAFIVKCFQQHLLDQLWPGFDSYLRSPLITLRSIAPCS